MPALLAEERQQMTAVMARVSEERDSVSKLVSWVVQRLGHGADGSLLPAPLAEEQQQQPRRQA
eukprot:1160178-Pelagomonas_calceolata.AAC.15